MREVVSGKFGRVIMIEAPKKSPRERMRSMAVVALA